MAHDSSKPAAPEPRGLDAVMRMFSLLLTFFAAFGFATKGELPLTLVFLTLFVTTERASR